MENKESSMNFEPGEFEDLKREAAINKMPEEEPEKELGANGELTDEEIDSLAPLAKKNAEEYFDFKKNEYKIITVTRDDIINRGNKLFDLYVQTDENELYLFKVKRPTESQRAKFERAETKKIIDYQKLTTEQMDALREQSFELMSALIVEPQMSVQEWKDFLDPALLNELSNKVTAMLSKVNDAEITAEFKKKSIDLMSLK